jgi:AcrR family transcriptional regulator
MAKAESVTRKARAAGAIPRSEPRSARANATRERILQAAIAEFAAHGLAGGRVDEIAARAGANKRMLYAYFGGKEELWLTVLETVYAAKRAEERSLAVDGLPPAEAMAALVRFNLRYTAAHPEFVALLNQENVHRAAYLKRSDKVRALYSPLVETLSAVLARGVAARVFRAGVDPRQLYITIVALGHFYCANIHTLSAILGEDLAGEGALAAREAHAVEVVLGYLRP